MEFSVRKFGKDDSLAEGLRVVRVHKIAPFTLMPAPVYVLLPRNGKYVSVKAPLDFFVPEELSRFAASGSFFFPKFVASVDPFQDAAARVRAILSWIPKADPKKGVMLPPSPFELSDAVLRVMAPLWGTDQQFEPFFAALLASQLCNPIESEELVRLRDADASILEVRNLTAGVAVLAALHLGQCELAYLSRLREGILRGDEKALGPAARGLARWAVKRIQASHFDPLTRASLEQSGDSIAVELLSRFARFAELQGKNTGSAPSVQGEGGFLGVSAGA